MHDLWGLMMWHLAPEEDGGSEVRVDIEPMSSASKFSELFSVMCIIF